MHAIIRHFDLIQRLPTGGYTMPAEARSFFEAYLKLRGVGLDKLKTYDELRDAIQACNAQDFERLIQKPAPTPGLRFLWNRLRRLGRSG